MHRKQLLPFIGLVCLTACDPQQYSAPTADFSAAVTAVVQGSKNAYQTVNDTAAREQATKMVASGDPNKFNPKEIRPFLPDEDLKIRYTLLDGLQAYGATLAGLTNKAQTEMDRQAAAVAASLESLKGNDRLTHSFREVKGATAEEINGLVTGVDALAKLIMSRKINKELPAMLKQAQPTIEGIAYLMAKEIGAPPGNPEPGRLRGRLWRSYDDLMAAQVTMISQDQSVSERRQDLAKLPDLVAQQRAADKALAATQAAFGRMVSAHKALLEVGTNPGGFKAAITALLAEVKDVQTFYGKLPSQ